MSYILDALKHSQDSRSRGEVPDLASQLASGRQRASRRERLWRTIALVAVLLLLALLVSLGWQRWLVAPAPESVPAPLAVQPAQPAAAPPVAVAAPAVPVVPSAPVAPVAPAPAAAPAAPAATPASAQAPGLAALHELAGVRVKVDAPEPPAAGAVGSPPPQAVQALDLPVEVGRVAPSAAVPAGVRSPLLPLPGRPAVSSQTVELRSSPQPSTEEALSAEFGAVEHWKKLPATVQQQLRDMPFNVHIYASDPKLRFVKSGGRTVHEGDPLNADLRMLHITRDGVIVGYKGGKYWMRLS